jgi:hypothetical protein
MEPLGKYVSAEMISRSNRRAVLSALSVPRVYEKDKGNHLSQLSFETPACQHMSLGAGEMN